MPPSNQPPSDVVPHDPGAPFEVWTPDGEFWGSCSNVDLVVNIVRIIDYRKRGPAQICGFDGSEISLAALLRLQALRSSH